MSNPTPEQWTAMSKLVQSFLSKPDTEPFREPVDWKNLGLFDYPQIIKNPMDLGTIKKKISGKNKQYKTIYEVDDDVRLVWKNCMTYNADGSEFYLLAQELNKKWDEKYKKLLSDHNINNNNNKGSSSGGGSASATGTSSSSKAGGGFGSTNLGSGLMGTSDSEVPLEEKRAFAKSLYKITKEELGKVLIELDAKNPNALVKNHAEDEIEINVDYIKPNVFNELVTYVNTCIKNAGDGSGGASTSIKSSSKKKKASSSSSKKARTS